MLNGRNISIIGAGVAGLAVARALALRGAHVRLYEQARAIREVGAGLQISPNGFAVLRALGLGDAVLGAGLQSQAVELRTHRGAPVLRMDVAQAGFAHPFVLIHRARLIDVLARGARDAGVEVLLDRQVRVDEVDAALVIGADGVKSVTREVLNGAAEPKFSGQVAWRAIVPDDGLHESHVYMGPGRHLVTYPLGQGQRNIVAVEERADWAEEGWSHSDDPANLRAAFKGFAPEVQGWLDQVDRAHLWGLFLHPVAQVWHTDRVALIGDAAHPTLPFMAQGANLALEDAWVLAACLERFEQDQALAAYQATRMPRVTRTLKAAQGNARNFHLSNPLMRFAAHSVLRIGGKIAPNATLKRFAWLYGLDVTT